MTSYAQHNAWCLLNRGGRTCDCDAFLSGLPLAPAIPEVAEFFNLSGPVSKRVLARTRETLEIEGHIAGVGHITPHGTTLVREPLVDFYDVKIKGWNCRTCRVFNGEEKEYRMRCRSCDAARPTS